MRAQYYESGISFMDFVFDFLYLILGFFSDVFVFFNTPFYLHVQELLALVGLDVDLSGFFETLGLKDMTLIAFMFGSGLAIFLTYSLIKWIIF